jgi:hypothetical protein
MIRRVLRVKRFTTDRGILLSTFEIRRWCPTRSPCWDCDRSNRTAGGRADSSWQDKDRQCSNCTRVFPLFSIQHNAWSFEVSESVRTVGAQRTEGSRKKLTEWVCPCNSYGIQMKEKICLTGLLLGKKESVLQCNENIPVHLQPKSLRLRVRHQLGRLCLPCVFWDSQGVLLAYFQKCGENANSASYCEVILKLRDVIHRKRPGQLARGVLLHNNNAKPHTAQETYGDFKNYSGNFLNIRLRGRTWPLVTFICLVR